MFRWTMWMLKMVREEYLAWTVPTQVLNGLLQRIHEDPFLLVRQSKLIIQIMVLLRILQLSQIMILLGSKIQSLSTDPLISPSEMEWLRTTTPHRGFVLCLKDLKKVFMVDLWKMLRQGDVIRVSLVTLWLTWPSKAILQLIHSVRLKTTQTEKSKEQSSTPQETITTGKYMVKISP